MKRALLFLCVLAALTTTGAAADLITVTQLNFSFDPDTVHVAPGDTVRWLYTSGDHTVTSGTGVLDPDMGLLFNYGLNIANPVVEHVFSDAGEFPYFCVPHFFFGMTGLVIVEETTSTEASTWSGVKALFAE